KKTVLHVTNSNAKSQYLLSIAKLYNKEKYNIVIGCFDVYGDLNIELEKLNIPTFNIPVKNNASYLFKTIAFIRLLKRNKVEILHLHTFFVSFFGIIAGRAAGVKQIVMTRHHADQHQQLNKKIHSRIDSWTANKADKVIAVSEFTKKIMIDSEKVKPEKIRVIYNGIEPLAFLDSFNEQKLIEELKINSADKILLCISRLYSEKNIDSVIKAMAILKDTQNFQLLVAGNGLGTPYHQTLIQLASDFDLSHRVHFLGFRNDIANLISFSDALVHPSFSESFGFAVLEAMSQGKSIIISDIPALNEIATTDIAYFFDPRSPKNLADIIIKWLNSKDITQRAEKGKERFEEKFTFSKMIDSYESYYEE
ncbi:MAG: glycosyltransferase family 4 protein, partial [Bacteroidia bacterium]